MGGNLESGVRFLFEIFREFDGLERVVGKRVLGTLFFLGRGI